MKFLTDTEKYQFAVFLKRLTFDMAYECADSDTHEKMKEQAYRIGGIGEGSKRAGKYGVCSPLIAPMMARLATAPKLPYPQGSRRKPQRIVTDKFCPTNRTKAISEKIWGRHCGSN
jgi:hypothetical protein